ncbi:MAG TPA: hypothetical protein PKA63_05265 [Oligoflexia bacterium]|nr:hypothetical protein [Oligoflexia bacterium]HMP48057.1 hypothetical protein [Oligoflexia bacterium]
MIVVVDGNDGVGKSTLVSRLRAHGIEVKDRGVPTKMTDDVTVLGNSDEFYIILDAPVEVSRERLLMAGKDLSEKYHTASDLTHYRKRFLDVAKFLINCVIIDASRDEESVYQAALAVLQEKNIV